MLSMLRGCFSASQPWEKKLFPLSHLLPLFCVRQRRDLGGRGDGKTQPGSPTPAGPHPHQHNCTVCFLEGVAGR